MAQYKTAIIIPVFNQWALTAQCLQSLCEHTRIVDVQILVVDNASSDDTRAYCAEMGEALFGDNFKYIQQNTNINFGPACNLGASHSDADFLFFLNNDTIVTPNWLYPLLQAFDENEALGAVGPLLLYPDQDRVQHLGVTFTPTNHVTHLYHNFPSNHPVVHKKRALQAITGAALMLPAALFQQIGGFWEEYRNGYEDLDLCWQIRKLKKTLQCETKSRVYHLTSQSDGRFDAEHHNSQVLMRRCGGVFYPDMHRFGYDDGYELRLTPILTANLIFTHPDLNPEVLTTEQLLSEIIQEPLWERGYDALLEKLYQQQLWESAYDLLQLQQCYLSTEKNLKNLAKVGSRLGNMQLLSYCRDALGDVRQKASSKEIVKKFNGILEWAEISKDAILLDICHKWRMKNFRAMN